MPIKIAIAADHAGFKLKQALKESFTDKDIEWLDLGTNSEDSVDYPDFAFTLAMAVAGGYADVGIGICDSGLGMTMAANRHPLIRAALCFTPESAKMARTHNDANVLTLGAKVTDLGTATACLEAFLNTPFSGEERHVRRVRKLSLVDEGGQGHDHDHEGGCCGGGSCGGGGHADHDHDGHGHGHGGGGCCGGGNCG